MSLATSGPISIGGTDPARSINAQFGRASNAQTSMSQLYRGGGIVTSNNTNVPASGAISLSNFYNATNQFTYTISTNQTNLNLRDGAIAAGWNQSTQLIVVIDSGVYVSSNSTGTPGLTVSGSFPGGVRLTNNGFIVGMGGAGGNGCNVLISNTGSGTAGSAGGLALSVSAAISITNNGTIGGGGGGGGGGQGRFASDESTTRRAGGGGGGGGRSSTTNSSGGTGGSASGGSPGSNGNPGTSSAAGTGGAGGSLPFTPSASAGAGGGGGGWGASGSTGANGTQGAVVNGPYSGGSAGAAVSGNSNITWVVTGTRLGAIA